MLKIEKNKNLLDFNFYKIKSKTKYFVELKNKKDFLEIFQWIKKNKIKQYFILGEGANTIFVNKKCDWLVIKIANNFFKWSNNEKNESINNKQANNCLCEKKSLGKDMVEVGAGKNWDKFLGDCQKKGFYDVQSLSAIPGTVGAAAFGNIGAFGTEIKKYIFGVWVLDIKKQEFVFLDNEKLDFSYRNSFFKKNKKDFLIYSVVFDFSPKFQKEMRKKYLDKEYFSLVHFAKKHNLGIIKKEEIRKNIKKIRRKIYPDIKKFPNVGSTFKNTEISESQLKKILKKYPDIPNWKLENKKIKIPAAYILDKVLDLNGKRFGNIKIDKKRPLFFINMGGATGEEFYKLCQKIKKMAKKEIGVKLEEEVYFIK